MYKCYLWSICLGVNILSLEWSETLYEKATPSTFIGNILRLEIYTFSMFTVFSISLILLTSFEASLLNVFSRIASLIFNFWFLKLLKLQLFFLVLQLFLFWFSNVLQSKEYVNLGSSIILLWSEGNNTSSPVRYSYLSILFDDNADIFAAFLLILSCSFFVFNYIISCHDKFLYYF